MREHDWFVLFEWPEADQDAVAQFLPDEQVGHAIAVPVGSYHKAPAYQLADLVGRRHLEPLAWRPRAVLLSPEDVKGCLVIRGRAGNEVQAAVAVEVHQLWTEPGNSAPAGNAPGRHDLVEPPRRAKPRVGLGADVAV